MPKSEEDAAAAAAAAIAAAPKQSWSGQAFVRSHAAAAHWAPIPVDDAHKHVHTMEDLEYTAIFNSGSSSGGDGKRSRGMPGWERRDTGVRNATDGLASVHVVRPNAAARNESPDRAGLGKTQQRKPETLPLRSPIRTPPYTDGDMQFHFVLSGQARLRISGAAGAGVGGNTHLEEVEQCIVRSGDSWVLPPGRGFEEAMVAGCDTTADFSVLEIWMSEAPATPN